MPYLKLHSYEPETPPPAPLPFSVPDRSWREAELGAESSKEEQMDSITMAERALADVQSKLVDLTEQVDDFFDPIPMSQWVDDDDDGPFAA